MKRFLAFVGSYYYPDKGMRDFLCDFDSKEEAIAEAMRQVSENCDGDLTWGVVYDSETLQEVWEV